MPIIHYFSDREQKKLNIKIFSILVIIIGCILTTYFIASNNIKPVQQQENEVVNENTELLGENLCVDFKIPSNFTKRITDLVVENKLSLKTTTDDNNCAVKIVRNPKDINPYSIVSTKVYVAVVPILKPLKSITTQELITSLNSQKHDKYSILWNSEVDDFLRSKYSFGIGQTTYVDSEINKKLSDNGNYIAIIPFENVNPTLKVLTIDNFDIVNNDISITSFPLSDTYWYQSIDTYKDSIKKIADTTFTITNYDRSKFSNIYLTGSSLVGADRYNNEILKGKKSDYMVSNISTNISKNDLLHVSNEVSIYNNCIQKIQSTYLCSLEKDFLPFKTLGVDVVGITGNHIMDFGYDTFIDTIDWYSENKVKTFGGGKNEDQAHTPAVISHNGIKYAFIGYNYIPPFSYYSSGNRGGSANVSLSMMRRDIAKAKKLADFVIVDMNWAEELQTNIDNSQRENAKYALEYGATIVNGVNSYSALGFDISNNSSTFYGLGGFINPVAKNGIVVKHIFYNKKYFGVELIPIEYSKDGTIVISGDKNKDKLITDIYNKSRIIYDK